MLRGQTAPQQRLMSSEVKGWNNLPPGVLEQILLSMAAKDCWAARQVATAWAHVARKVATFELTITTSPRKVCSKIAALSKRDSTVVYPRVLFTIKIQGALEACDCIKMLVNMQKLGPQKMQTITNLEFGIRLIGADHQVCSYAKVLAELLDHLVHQGVCVRVILHPGRKQNLLPSALQCLVPFLHKVVLHDLADHFQFQQCSMAKLFPVSTSTQLRTISSARSLEALCIFVPEVDNINTISSIGNLHNLRTLHLCTLGHHANYQSLASLSRLEDLSLQCSNAASCFGVLESSKQSLQHVKLSANTWDDATYSALQHIQHLATLDLRLGSLERSAAEITANLAMPDIRIMLGRCRPGDSRALSSGCGHIKHLELWGMNDDTLGLLKPMPCLTQLTIAQSPRLTGKTMRPQVNLTRLTLINCSGITETGIESIVKACPAVQSVAFLTAEMINTGYYIDGAEAKLALSQNALKALACLHCLQEVDLRGVSGLRTSDMCFMRSQYLAQQSKQKAQCKLTVTVPSDLSRSTVSLFGTFRMWWQASTIYYNASGQGWVFRSGRQLADKPFLRIWLLFYAAVVLTHEVVERYEIVMECSEYA